MGKNDQGVCMIDVRADLERLEMGTLSLNLHVVQPLQAVRNHDGGANGFPGEAVLIGCEDVVHRISPAASIERVGIR